MKLMVIILNKLEAMEYLLEGLSAAGIGGATTALAVNIDYCPTHIAGMPVAVNMCCHCARHAEMTL